MLTIGNLKAQLPIIQGGMGVRISRAKLAAAVANEGGIGVIASVGLGSYQDYQNTKFTEVNQEALRCELRKARKLSNGIIGVNIMVAASDYENLVKVAFEEQVDVIISGAGLPMNLPSYANNSRTKLIPIVSSERTLKIICKRWKQRYNRLPDAVIFEGSKAGGHLGYSMDDLLDDTLDMDNILRSIVEYSNTFTPKIPVISAGGIFTGCDIAHSLNLGASGVQMATRFVCTHECDADIKFKNTYLNAGKEDITLINSPVGLPGKVILNPFVNKIKSGLRIPFKCQYKCLRTCDPAKAPYCIANVLTQAAEGNFENAFAFAGSNAFKCTEIVSVKSLMDTLKLEYRDSFVK